MILNTTSHFFSVIEQDTLMLRSAYYKFPIEKSEQSKVYLAFARIIGTTIFILGLINLYANVCLLTTSSDLFDISHSIGLLALGHDIFKISKRFSDQQTELIQIKKKSFEDIANQLAQQTFFKPFWVMIHFHWCDPTLQLLRSQI